MRQNLQNVNVTLGAYLHVSQRSGYSRQFPENGHTWALGSVAKGILQKRTLEIDLLYGVHNYQAQLPKQLTPEGRNYALQVQGTSSGGSIVRLEYFIDIDPVCGGCRLSGKVGPGARVFIRLIKGIPNNNPQNQVILEGAPINMPQQTIVQQNFQPQRIQYSQVAQLEQPSKYI